MQKELAPLPSGPSLRSRKDDSTSVAWLRSLSGIKKGSLNLAKTVSGC